MQKATRNLQQKNECVDQEEAFAAISSPAFTRLLTLLNTFHRGAFNIKRWSLYWWERGRKITFTFTQSTHDVLHSLDSLQIVFSQTCKVLSSLLQRDDRISQWLIITLWGVSSFPKT